MDIFPHDAIGVNGQGPYFVRVALDPTIPTAAKALYAALVALGGSATYEALGKAGWKGATLTRARRPLEALGVVEHVRLDNRTWVLRLVDPGDPPNTSDPVKSDPVKAHVLKKENTPLPPNTPTRSKLTDSDSPLVRDLAANGVWPSVARKLAREHDEAVIRAWIEQAQLWGGDLRNRGGWLRCALVAGWKLPVPVVSQWTTEEVTERVATAIFAAMTDQDKYQILSRAKAANSEVCRRARGIASYAPGFKPSMDATICVDFLSHGLRPHYLGAPVSSDQVHAWTYGPSLLRSSSRNTPAILSNVSEVIDRSPRRNR